MRNIEIERERDKAYYRRTADKQKQRHKDYRKRKPYVIAALAAKRRAMIKAQTPDWANLSEIKRYYEVAARKTAQLGVLYAVDHIVPLKGKNVCGLHVENNLRVITFEENSAKSNKLIEDLL
jgi:hypothetical protein